MSQDFLLGNITPDQLATYTYDKFSRGLEELEERLTEDIYYSVYASYQSLQVIQLEFDVNEGDRFSNPENDVASSALRAFAGIDDNPPGEWFIENAQLLKYNSAKEMEFWEWWLNEAIPEAWELANER